jgi:hypothetical protein
MKRVRLSYKLTAEDMGTTVAFIKGPLWWKLFIPGYVTEQDVGMTGKELLGLRW